MKKPPNCEVGRFSAEAPVAMAFSGLAWSGCDWSGCDRSGGGGDLDGGFWAGVEASVAGIERGGPVHAGQGQAVSRGHPAHVGHGVLAKCLGIFAACQQSV